MADVEAETVPASEYKKLQRKYDRRNMSARKSEERIEGLESGVSRLEHLIEGLTTLVAATDDGLKPVATDLLAKNTSRRASDTTSSQLQARLNQLVEDADESWDDKKFDSARRILTEINTSGDLTRAGEFESAVRAAISPPVTTDEVVAAAVAKALLEVKKDSAKVDTGTTTVIASGKVRLADVANLDPRKGVKAMRETMKAALDQMQR